jgi:hypothetical protein
MGGLCDLYSSPNISVIMLRKLRFEGGGMNGLGQVTRCFDGGNEPSASIQYMKYVDKLWSC